MRTIEYNFGWGDMPRIRDVRTLPDVMDVLAVLPRRLGQMAIDILAVDDETAIEHLSIGSTPSAKLTKPSQRGRMAVATKALHRVFGTMIVLKGGDTSD